MNLKTGTVSGQRLGKHVPAAMNTYVIIELLLETVFATQTVQRSCKEDIRATQSVQLIGSSAWEGVNKGPEGGLTGSLYSYIYTLFM
jgi:hypothetical protein